ncbi:MAG: PP2C family protein-serine/threonine phosphatase [Gammaproteobacteria bacterium]
MVSFDNSDHPTQCAEHCGIRFCYVSHPGLTRENNEDSFLLLPQYGIWAVADGMGGHNCGEIASAIALATLRQNIGNSIGLAAALQNCHKAIQNAALADEWFNDMGATIVTVKIIDRRYEVAWVGDSRAYLWRNRLIPLTKDHSIVQMMLDQGLIDAQEALTHPYRSVITQALGGVDSDYVSVDTVENSLENGDLLLLCSDGLNNEVSDAQISTILSGDADPEQKTRQLLDAALANGGKDNVTVILLAP